jgi:hypothetical protein
MPLRRETLRLYRDLLRTAGRMPTANQRSFVATRVKNDFQEHRNLFAEEADFQFLLGETHLETLLLQTEHLNEVLSTPGYHYHEYDLPTPRDAVKR